jgi:uncharacterized phage protein (TIGR02218 family)
MSYASELENIVQGDFAELYDFAIAGQHWYYTSYQQDVEFLGEDYLATAIKRSSWSNENELRPVQVKITVPLTEFVTKFIANYPVQRVSVRIIRWFLEDSAAYFQIFDGEIISTVITKTGAELSCESASLLYSSSVPRIVHQAACNHVLFDDGCGLDEYNYRVAAAAVTVAGSTLVHVTFDTYDDGYFAWGRVKTSDSDYRLITAHVGDTITLQSPFPLLATGDAVTVWPGCDKMRATCATKFGNFNNFLGFPFIPSHNPVIFGIETEA